MRKIKFRAISTSNDFSDGNWVYGTFYKSFDKYYMVEELTGSVIKINPETIGEFVELHDINKDEIYEGDIIEVCGKNLKSSKTYETFQAKIGDRYFCIKLVSGFTLCPIRYFNSIAMMVCDNDIVSNIHGYIDNYDFWNGASTASKIVGNVHEVINNV